MDMRKAYGELAAEWIHEMVDQLSLADEVCVQRDPMAELYTVEITMNTYNGQVTVQKEVTADELPSSGDEQSEKIGYDDVSDKL